MLGTDRKLAWPIAVIGSCSGYYLEKIVAALRRSFPGSEIHGWLGPLQAESASHLFDVIHRLPSAGPSLPGLRRLVATGRRYRGWIVPCTDEPFGWLKFLAFSGPLPRRRLYNETGDGFPLHRIDTVWQHICWRLRHKFTFQFLSASPDSNFLQRLIHVPAYSVRLASALPMLLRATRRPRKNPTTQPAVEVLTVSSPESRVALNNAFTNSSGNRLRIREFHPDGDIFEQLWDTATSSSAEYICLLDGRSEVSTLGWLGKLLNSFDETVAQAAPELLRTDRQQVCQGAFLDQSGALIWNTNSAARSHGAAHLLEVGVLPWVCLVIRREALLQVGLACAGRHSGRQWLLAELSHQFAIHGWLSICNTQVAVSHPLTARQEQYHLSTAS